MRAIEPNVKEVKISIFSSDYNRMVVLAKRAARGTAVVFDSEIKITDDLIEVLLFGIDVPEQKVRSGKQVPVEKSTIISNNKDKVLFLLDSNDVHTCKGEKLNIKTELLSKGTKYRAEIMDKENALIYESADIELNIIKNKRKYSAEQFQKDFESIEDMTPQVVQQPPVLSNVKYPTGYNTVYGDYQQSLFDPNEHYDF